MANPLYIIGSTTAPTDKTTPVNGDNIPLLDSADSSKLKKLSWTNIKATLKTYFDTLYQASGTYVTSVAGTAPVASSGGTTPTISMHVADSTHDGYLSSTDWSTFNGKQPAGTYVTSVTGTSPVTSSGGTTPAISLASGYGDTQNPYASKTANYFLSSPNGSAGVPTFRAIVAADIPTLNQNTTGSAGSLKSTATTGLLTITGPGAASTRVMTTPDANFTAARTDAGQTFTGAQAFGSAVFINGTVLGLSGNFESYSAGYGALAAFRSVPGDGVNPYLLITTSSSGITFEENGSSYGSLIFKTGATNRVTISSGGDATINTGNLVIGTSGKGIDFSATSQASGMTSELLADYEEGTWTPAFAAESGTATVTYSTQSGEYTKMGRTVIATFKLDWTSATITGNILLLSGVPFTSNAAKISGYVTMAYRVDFTNVSGSTGTQLLIQNYNTTNCAFMSAGDSLNPADGRLGPGAIAVNGSLYGTLIYNV